MRVLITRPEEDAVRTAERLREMGHEPVVQPLLETRFRDGPEVFLDGVQAILATSANGVRALMRRTPRRDVPVFTVGPQTAESAREFATVRNADGDAFALVEATRRWAVPQGGPLLHVKSAESGAWFEERLPAFDVRSLVLYDVVENDARLTLEGVDAALFLSPRSAGIFARRAPDTSALVAVCISQATATVLSSRAFKEVRVAARPNQESLLVCLD